MRTLLACTCLTPVIILAAASAARAETTISTKITDRIRTSTIKSGAADDIKIGTDGSVVPAAAGAAVTIDSNHSVKNEGAITITDLNDSTGILANAGISGSITNSGKIEVIETYAPADGDKDGDIDGGFASGARRFGIRIAPGGIFTGSITNSGTITVEGNDSAGIAIDSRLAGSLNSSGSVAVTGDRSVGIRAAEVTGDVKVTGSVAAQGANAVAIALDGDVGGALIIQNSVAATGYRSTTAPADTSKLDADDLLQGGSALRISGNVGKGILFDAPPPNNSTTDNDEDKDGVEDAKEGIASITSYGAAPAVLIGAADRAIAVGAVAGNANGHGLVIKGGVGGHGVYGGVAGTAIQIGGLGGAVNIAGGITVAGSVTSSSKDASATAIRIASGSTVKEIRNSGKIEAIAGGSGTAGAVIDLSGSLALIENSGAIAASGVALDTGRAVAIDLRANMTGAIVRQILVGQNVAAPSLSGNILFGAGDDLLDLADGGVKGATQFGAGANRLSMSGDSTYAGSVQFGAGADRVTLAGTSSFAGAADFGGGADVLTLSNTSRFSGSVVNSANLAVEIGGGTFEMSGTGPVALGSLAVGAQGILGVTIDPLAGKSTTYQVGGAASFAQGSKLQVKLTSVGGSLGKFTVLKATSLTGTSGLTATSVLLPIFLKSSLAANEQQGEIAVTIGRKTAAEIGLNGSETIIWDGMFAALDKDTKVAGAFLEMSELETFKDAVQAMLPEHAGGLFETVTQGSRATARIIRDPGSPFADRGGWGFWLQQVAWGTSKDLGDTSAYDITGWGAAGGAEAKLGGAGNLGLSLAYLDGRDDQSGNDNRVAADQYEIAAYWRGEWGPVRAHARASAATIGFEGRRTFTGTIGNEVVTREAVGEWDGRLYSVSGGLSYELPLGRLSLRPAGTIDYYRLSEEAYTETGGGGAMDLTVDKRTSDELAAEASLTAGYELGSLQRDSGWTRIELEGGRRQILGGSVGDTVARFGTGPAFTLRPEDRSDGWVGKLRLMGGNADFSVGGEFSAEQQQGRAAIAFRAGLQVPF